MLGNLNRTPALIVALVSFALVIALPAQAQDPPATRSLEPPLAIQRGLPSIGHDALKALEGTWAVEMSIFVAIGTRERPTVSTDIVSRRDWVAGGRYLRDVTEGTIAGSPYYRAGFLGYSNMDRRYEWVTIDATNANMMVYQGEVDAGPGFPITMSGVFTDQGWLGEEVAGKPVKMRTVITIEDQDRHVFELYFTPPDGGERLIDRKVYTRIGG